MYTSDMAKINQNALDKVKQYKPDFSQFNNGKEFMELYDSGVEFAQTFFYDKTEGGNPGRTNFNLDLGKKDEFIRKVREYNEKLEVAQEEAIKESGIGEYDTRTYRYYQRVGDNIGIAHFNVFVRSKAIDREEERLERIERMKNQKNEDYEEEQGPYGGAFRDWEDFYDHVGIKVDR